MDDWSSSRSRHQGSDLHIPYEPTPISSTSSVYSNSESGKRGRGRPKKRPAAASVASASPRAPSADSVVSTAAKRPKSSSQRHEAEMSRVFQRVRQAAATESGVFCDNEVDYGNQPWTEDDMMDVYESGEKITLTREETELATRTMERFRSDRRNTQYSDIRADAFIGATRGVDDNFITVARAALPLDVVFKNTADAFSVRHWGTTGACETRVASLASNVSYLDTLLQAWERTYKLFGTFADMIELTNKCEHIIEMRTSRSIKVTQLHPGLRPMFTAALPLGTAADSIFVPIIEVVAKAAQNVVVHVYMTQFVLSSRDAKRAENILSINIMILHHVFVHAT